MMNSGKNSSIARPYALAAFEFAQEKNEVAAWETLLSSAATLVADPTMQQVLSSPKVTAEQLDKLFCDILSKQLSPASQNFIHLLAQNKRLALIPAIAELFKTYREAWEKSVSVEVISAVPLDEAYQAKLVTALTSRLQRKIQLECEVDPSVLGGVIVRAGDTVIDGSVRGKLTRLLESF